MPQPLMQSVEPLPAGPHRAPLADFPFADHWLQQPAGRMHYVDEGPRDGGLIVCLHGNPTWSYFYRRVIAALCDRWRVVVPDHLGMGLSEMPTSDSYRFTFAERVADLERLLDEVAGDDPITLVVHDWGGMIGMAYATRHPDRVSRLVVMNTAAFRLPATKRMPWQLNLARNGLMGPLLVQGLNAFCLGAARQCVVRHRLPDEVRRAYLAPYHGWSRRKAVLRFVQDIPLSTGDESYAPILAVEEALPLLSDKPIFLGWGLRDFVFDRHFLDVWRQHFPRAEVHAWDDAGHYLLEDAPDEVIPLIRSFLERHAATGD